MGERIGIMHVRGISPEEFTDFNQFGLRVETLEAGIRAQRIDELLVEYIDIITVNLPVDFVRDLIKDSTKQLFIKLAKILYKLWKRPKDQKAAVINAVGVSQGKEYRVIVIFRTPNNTKSVLQLKGDMPEEVINKTIDGFYDVVKQQIKEQS